MYQHRPRCGESARSLSDAQRAQLLKDFALPARCGLGLQLLGFGAGCLLLFAEAAPRSLQRRDGGLKHRPSLRSRVAHAINIASTRSALRPSREPCKFSSERSSINIGEINCAELACPPRRRGRSRQALSNGMQRFQISAAKHLNAADNWRKHRDDRSRLARAVLWRRRETYQPLVYQPRTWLLGPGWQRGGPLITFREVPSAAAAEA